MKLIDINLLKKRNKNCNSDNDYCSFGLWADCSLCLKESHCKAIKEAEREELND